MSVTESVTGSVTESVTESDTESVWDTECKEWGELEIQIQQMIQGQEEAIASLERIQEALSSEIYLIQDGVSRSFEEVLDELSVAEQSAAAQVAQVAPFWLQVQKVIENADLI